MSRAIRSHYIAFMEWAGNSNEIVLQQLNRRQDTVRVMLADIHVGKGTTALKERDNAWVDLQDRLQWIEDGKEFLWLSERDGWRTSTGRHATEDASRCWSHLAILT